LAQASPLSAAELRSQVTSRGGTTHAAIAALDAGGVHAAFVRALHAARLRASELGDEFGR
jgi:pyrroline-5-carboxylate reductase